MSGEEKQNRVTLPVQDGFDFATFTAFWDGYAKGVADAVSRIKAQRTQEVIAAAQKQQAPIQTPQE